MLREYHVLGHISYNEGFPYFVNEFLTQGMVPFCHEEWWDGYDDSRLLWSYDPELSWRNEENIDFLLDPNFREELLTVRNAIHTAHMSRSDNEWGYFLGELYNEIDKIYT